jgi:acyl carrier protein
MTERYSTTAIQEWILARLAADFGLDPATVNPHNSFESYGLASRDLVMLSGDLEDWLGVSLSPVLLYEHPSLHALAAYLAGERENETVSLARPPANGRTNRHHRHGLPLPRRGWAGRFLGAADQWRRWDSGSADGRWNQTQLEQSLPGKNGDLRTRWGGFLDNVDQFDAHFFGIAPREAVHIDPQQRILLEVTWDALADAGLPASQLAGSPTGVFVGISGSEYGQANWPI